MKSVVELVSRQQWAPALVRLWTLARDPRRLNRWERARKSEGFEQRVDELAARLDSADSPTLDECEASPLELIRAVDRLLWSETGPTTFSGAPYVDHASGEAFWLWRTGTSGRRLTPLNRQAGAKAHWFHYHEIAPTRTSHGIDVCVVAARGGLGAATAEAAKASSLDLCVWVAHFEDACEVRWDRSQSPAGRVRADGINGELTRTAAMLESVKRAVDARARIIVMPELSIDLQMRGQLLRYLETLEPAAAPYVVVPGSFHEAEASGFFNTAPMVDGCGAEELFKHRKLRTFGIIGDGGKGDAAEDIDIGDQFQILVTEVGAFGILICKDFLDIDARVNGLLQEVPVDWILVPSYGDKGTREAHLRRAEEIAFKSVGCRVVLANIRNLGIGKDEEHLPGFIWQPNSREAEFVGDQGGPIKVTIQTLQAEFLRMPTKAAKPRLRRIK